MVVAIVLWRKGFGGTGLHAARRQCRRCVWMKQLPCYRQAVCVILVFASWSAGRGDIPHAVSHTGYADNAPASRDPGG